MKTFLSSKILNNDYIKLIVILVLGYILTHTPFRFTGKIGFLIVIFLLYLPKINKDTMFYYSLIFGLFNDYMINSFIGLSVILFIFLSIVWISLSEMFSMSGFISKLSGALFILFLFNIFYMVYFDYYLRDFFDYGLLRIALDYFLYVIIFSMMEFRRAFSDVKG